MTTSIYVAKYVADPRRWEPRNIGVVVVGDDRVAARFLGERRPGSVDRRTVRFRVGDSEVYEEWVRYWRRVIAEGPSGLVAATKSTSPNYILMEQGSVWAMQPDTEIDELADSYFDKLVRDAQEPEQVAVGESLEVAADRVIERVEQKVGQRIRRNFEVAHSTSPVSERLRFTYGFINGHVTVAQRVSLYTEILAHDALYKLLYLPRVLDNREVVAVSFVRREDGGEAVHLVPFLEQQSHVIDLSRPDSLEMTERIFAGLPQ